MSTSMPTIVHNYFTSKAPTNGLSVYMSQRRILLVSTGTHERNRWFLSTHSNLLGATNQRIQPFGSIRVKADISQSAWSESAQSFARSCIEACAQHERCRFAEPLLPTRVIEVGNAGDERLRLSETRGNRTGQYTALSYCWGSDQQLKTMCANIQAMRSGLLLSELPRTLADAVYVTRSLGIQYLWIDALCIIQDSPEDWETESAKMSNIYEKSYLVIAASSSSSATQGFLGHQRQEKPYYVSVPGDHGTQTTIAARRDPMSGIHSHRLKTDPLDQRAWAFQEQHMSTRCLIFSTDELQWQCRTTSVCECGGTAPRSSYHPLLRECCDDTYRDDVARAELRLQAGDVWHNVVSAYNCRRLTHIGDKLPAISGIASRFGATMGFRYVAGLWEENMVKDLAWKQNSWLPGPSLPIDDTAPSFSWASINHTVSYLFQRYDQICHWIPCSSVSDAGTVVPGRNPFGKVSEAWITLQAPMLRGCLKVDTSLHGEFLFDDGKMTKLVDMDSTVTVFSYTAENGETEESVRRWKCVRPASHSKLKRGQPRAVDEGPLINDPYQTIPRIPRDGNRAFVWLLQLGRWTVDQAGIKMNDPTFGFYLVLGKSLIDPQKYERIGFCDGTQGSSFAAHHGKFTTQTITIL